MGFFFGVVQMLLYAFYKNKTKKVVMEEKIQPAEQLKNQVIVVVEEEEEEEKEQQPPPEPAEQVIDIAKLRAVCREMVPFPNGCGMTGDFPLARPNMEIPVSV